MIKRIHHVALSTGDLQAMVRFYCEVLGFDRGEEADWRAGSEFGLQADRVVGLNGSAARMAMVSKAGLIVEFFEYAAPAPKPKPADWKVSDHGYTHLCLEVEDIDGEYRRLSASGMTFHAPPPADYFAGMKAIYGRDPEGNVIELLEFASEP